MLKYPLNNLPLYYSNLLVALLWLYVRPIFKIVCMFTNLSNQWGFVLQKEGGYSLLMSIKMEETPLHSRKRSFVYSNLNGSPLNVSSEIFIESVGQPSFASSKSSNNSSGTSAVP